MLRRAALIRTEVSDELSASLIWVTRIGERGRRLALTSNRRMLRRNNETSVLTRATRHNIPEDTTLNSHRRENLKYYIFNFVCTAHSLQWQIFARRIICMDLLIYGGSMLPCK
jgi:hypothetical protein